MIEKKKVYLKNNYGYICDLLHFGWMDIEIGKEKVGNKKLKYHILSRDTEIPNYSDLCSLEEEYENVKKELFPYPKFNGFTIFIVCCLIFPFFIYYFYMQSEIKAVDTKNEEFYLKMREILNKADELCE